MIQPGTHFQEIGELADRVYVLGDRIMAGSDQGHATEEGSCG